MSLGMTLVGMRHARLREMGFMVETTMMRIRSTSVTLIMVLICNLVGTVLKQQIVTTTTKIFK